MSKVLFYENKYFLFSNFSATAVIYNGRLYPTSEHAYQAAKFDSDDIVEKIREAKSPSDAKRLANKIYKKFKKANWETIKVRVMYEIVSEKVKQHAEISRLLLGTGNAEIIENSPIDYFWGAGKDGTGQNQLGKVLMKIRRSIRKG